MWNVDESYRDLMRLNDLEQRLLRWRLAHSLRDQLVREASGAGLRSHRIAELTGLSRQTVSRIVTEDPRTERQAPK